jgi:site-specific recombinase XerD
MPPPANVSVSGQQGTGHDTHGHRHAYGRRLRNASVDKPLIRRFMHHASDESQQVYTQATTREAIAALEAAAQRLRDGHAKTLSAPHLPLPGIELND